MLFAFKRGRGRPPRTPSFALFGLCAGAFVRVGLCRSREPGLSSCERSPASLRSSSALIPVGVEKAVCRSPRRRHLGGCGLFLFLMEGQDKEKKWGVFVCAGENKRIRNNRRKKRKLEEKMERNKKKGSIYKDKETHKKTCILTKEFKNFRH